MYALPANAIFLTWHDIAHINAAIKEFCRCQICEKIDTEEELIAQIDERIVQKSPFSGHNIH